MSEPLIIFDDVLGVTQVSTLDSDFHVSFELYPGEIGIFKGGLQASSLTLLAASRGIITHGVVTILGTIIGADDNPAKYLSIGFTKKFRKCIGYCHYGGGLLANLSLIQNVTLSAHYHSNNPDRGPYYKKSQEKLRELNVPEGLWDLRPSDVPSEFQKRVLLSRATVHEPRILILDEPTAHIPWERTHEIAGWIIKQKERGMGVLIATNNDPFACIVGDWVVDLDRSIGIFNKKDMVEHFGTLALESGGILKKQME